MLFTDPLFLFGFLPVVWCAWHLLRLVPARQSSVLVLMIVASLFFYSWGQLQHLVLLVGSIVLNWTAGFGIVRANSRAAFFIVSVAVLSNLLLLATFKYAGFFTGQAFNIVLPLAISFFTFQQISYVCDTYRWRQSEPNFLRYAFVVSFFPHLIAGPIVRYREIKFQFPKLFLCQTLRWNLLVGFFLIVAGLAKKLLIADSISPLVDSFYALPPDEISHAGSAAPFVALFAFYLQIYFDFSGYTDMAIGLARLFNIRFPNNFNYPYRARSMSDFWRRWHITLSRFLRDYLYIPLGGSRAGMWRSSLNLMITMLLGGLWHGAAWNFLVWGGLHGLALVVLHIWQSGQNQPRLPIVVSWIATQTFVFLSWIAFRAPNLASAESVMYALGQLDFALSPAVVGMVNAFRAGPFVARVLPADAGLYGVIAFLGSSFLLSTIRPTFYQLIWLRRHPIVPILLLTCLSSAVALALWNRVMLMSRIDPFIYFQF